MGTALFAFVGMENKKIAALECRGGSATLDGVMRFVERSDASILPPRTREKSRAWRVPAQWNRTTLEF
jgi:hypothetical protein